MNLIIDIGNTQIKFALFDANQIVNKGVGDVKDFQDFIKEKNIKYTLISSVSKSREIEKVLKKNKLEFIHLDSNLNLPINNHYTTPKTLGDDRLANVVGAQFLFPNQNVLTIDAGTCIKFDAVSVNGDYKGGAISPGLWMRFKALNHFTNALPMVKPKSIDFFIGNSSENSILSGVVNGTVQEIEGVIAQYQSIYENLTVILTGGDASFFDNELKSNIFVESNLTLIGLNEILRYNTLT